MRKHRRHRHVYHDYWQPTHTGFDDPRLRKQHYCRLDIHEDHYRHVWRDADHYDYSVKCYWRGVQCFGSHPSAYPLTGQSATISILFNPQSAGTVSGNLTVASDAANS